MPPSTKAAEDIKLSILAFLSVTDAIAMESRPKSAFSLSRNVDGLS